MARPLILDSGVLKEIPAAKSFEVDAASIRLNSSGAVELGDVDVATNGTRIMVDETNGLINLHNHSGPIQLGDIDGNGNSVTLAVRDDVRRFVFSNGNDATPFGLEFPGSGGGGMIATAASQLIAFWGATPRVQPTTSHAAATFTANSGTAVNDASTFDGYTLKQVVKALRDTGLLA